MTTEELIAELARAAKPVTPLATPGVRLVRWAAGFGALALVAVIALGARQTIGSDLSRPAFLALAAVTIATAGLAAAAAFRSSVPGLEAGTTARALPAAGAIAWAALLGLLVATGGDAMTRLLAFPIHAGCIANIFLIGLVPGVTLLSLVRQGAPLNPVRSAALASLASLSLAAAAVQFVCPIDDPAHHLDGHLLPVLIFTAAGTLAGARWLRGEARKERTRTA